MGATDWLVEVELILERLRDPEDEHCRCVPGVGSVSDSGRCFCDDCGGLMLASTIGEFIRRHLEQRACSQ